MDGVPVGLDYAAVEPIARSLEIAITMERFMDLRAMEAAALDETRKRRK